MPSLSCNGKPFLVTGAAGGIGAALARELRKRGARLILADIDGPRLTRLVAELGEDVTAAALDLTQPAGRDELKSRLDRDGIAPTGLMNCLGSTYSKPFSQATRREIDNIFSLNLHAMVDLCHLFLPGMLAQGEGYILNMSSTSAFIPCPEMVCYSATKAFINNFSHTLGIELAPRNILVRYACPGAVDTGFFAAAGMDRLEYTKKVRKMHPEYVARQCLRLFESRAHGGVIGFKNKINMAIARALPNPVLDWVVARRFS